MVFDVLENLSLLPFFFLGLMVGLEQFVGSYPAFSWIHQPCHYWNSSRIVVVGWTVWHLRQKVRLHVPFYGCWRSSHNTSLPDIPSSTGVIVKWEVVSFCETSRDFPDKDNGISFPSSLLWVQVEKLQSLPVIFVLHPFNPSSEVALDILYFIDDTLLDNKRQKIVFPTVCN